MNKSQKKLHERIRQAQILDQEHLKLVAEHADMLDFIYLAAASRRRNGTYNNTREALQQKAKLVLDKLQL